MNVIENIVVILLVLFGIALLVAVIIYAIETTTITIGHCDIYYNSTMSVPWYC
jgi:hypothetical protein